MNLDQLLQSFIVECRELLQEMEAALLGIEGSETDAETINSIFRAAHTIKGSAGLFSLDQIVHFTHLVESVLDHVREGQVALNDKLVALLLSCSDHIGTLVDEAQAGQLSSDAETTLHGEALLDRLRTFLPLDASGPEVVVTRALAPHAESASNSEAFERVVGPVVGTDHWHISLRFGRDVLRNGMDPLSFIRYLGRIGQIINIVTLPDALPPVTEMDPEDCYLGFEIALRSDADKATIEDVFEFVRDDSVVRILPPHSRVAEYVRLIDELQEEPVRLGDILVRCGTITEHELAEALAEQARAKSDQPIGAILVGQSVVQPAVVAAALSKQKHVKDLKSQENQSIRVDAEKLDHLINLVGELIIAAASADLAARRTRNAELQECNSTLSSLVQDVRDSALQLRMVKIGATFSRFQRVVHDVSRDLGKDIGLVVSGEDTELDKTVVEKIADPLMHLVRNAVDHGIESSDVRMARGKPVRGTVRLNAYHDSGTIVIEVSDDGGGLKRDRILARGIERGLVEPGRTLSDSEIYALIFEPGFSTAEQVTNLSGRGVGMDVVKRNITALRGQVDVSSEEGMGTTVTVRLPLTLAIIDGFLVGLGKSVFVLPLDMVEECVEFSCEPGHDYANLRGSLLPFIRLRDIFEVDARSGRRENIVVVRHAGRKVGLVVDALLGEFQTVIKPLSKMFGHVKCISGSTILGSGEVALILDVPSLIQQAGDPQDHNIPVRPATDALAAH
ncbi:MAG: chemotaxis protein CheA [Burkholderiales bacterium]|nr:chemotaxis protein CheA [Burkholderiales bacterium]